jgi:glutamyl/glutaminyl-tRNA synthetase
MPVPSLTAPPPYRGRIAPSPTGYLHLGHARTFWTAQERARAAGGVLVLRNEDLDGPRCRPEFVTAMIEDLHWIGFRWTEGPDCGGPFGPYNQSARFEFYAAALHSLYENDLIYPCTCSRKDLQRVARAPHAGDDDEPLYPGFCRERAATEGAAWMEAILEGKAPKRTSAAERPPNWRFRTPPGQPVVFTDAAQGAQRFVAGTDFGDFVVWRHDNVPAYQLAVTVDDAAMRMSEVVRGEDLLLSTARQLLLYSALNLSAPSFYHCPLMLDENGVRLAKRTDALSLRSLRAQGRTPEEIRDLWHRA